MELVACCTDILVALHLLMKGSFCWDQPSCFEISRKQMSTSASYHYSKFVNHMVGP